jgi:hypothetical protein
MVVEVDEVGELRSVPPELTKTWRLVLPLQATRSGYPSKFISFITRLVGKLVFRDKDRVDEKIPATDTLSGYEVRPDAEAETEPDPVVLESR